MRGLYIIIAVVCVLVMFLGLFSVFDSLFGYDGFANDLFAFLGCSNVCTWLVVLGGAFLAGFFLWLASKSHN